MQSPSPRIGFIAIARPTFDVPLAQELAAQVFAALSAEGYQLIGDAELVMDAEAAARSIDRLHNETPVGVIALQASFADSTMIVELARRVHAPLLLWALPEARAGGRLRLNSFCGINLAAHGLRRAGLRYEYVYGAPDDVRSLESVRSFVKAAAIRRKLRGARVGRIGENPAGFDTCRVNRPALRERLGVEVEQIELADVFAHVRNGAQEKVAAVAERVRTQIVGMDDMDADATAGTLGTYVTMRELIETQHLDGLAVRCWPEFFTELGCAACGAMSMTSEDMIPCSCEVDVNGTITQIILQGCSGEPAFGSDLVAFDADEDVAVLWHCGLAPLSMADPSVQPEATIHSNRKLPLLMQFPLKPGRISLARLSEATGEFRLVIASGEMLQAPPAFTGTTGTLRFDSGAGQVMDTLMREGLEHHLSITYGDHVEALEMLARMLEIPILRL
ncbi:MAG: L-fucose/L-arabinose isomerase family protein [Anaerolineae bacterium]|nr:L-fucose/L-arabinose isomerase family protein [Anaerolineae bacterium]